MHFIWHSWQRKLFKHFWHLMHNALNLTKFINIFHLTLEINSKKGFDSTVNAWDKDVSVMCLQVL